LFVIITKRKKKKEKKIVPLNNIHESALRAGIAFAKTYGKAGFRVLDVGSQDVNGSLRSAFEEREMKYVGMDMCEGRNVDVIVKPFEAFPFEAGSFDLVISTSCFEHDPMPWMTIREMARVIKLGGFIYANAPSNGCYHAYPCDNFRYYSDSAQAFAVWTGRKFDGAFYPLHVEETFHTMPLNSEWIDWVAVWQRVNEPATGIVVSDETRNKVGLLKAMMHKDGCETSALFPF